MKKLPPGLYPVMLTPFNASNELDLDGLRNLTKFYIDAGAKGLFANCLSSEMYQLTATERLQIIKTVVEAAPDDIPVVAAGTFSQDAKVNTDFIKKVHALGVQAVVINTNQLTNSWESDTVFKKQVENLLTQTADIPFGLYECPVPYKRVLSPEIMRWLGQTERFLYLKDTCCDQAAIHQKIEAVKDTPLGIFDAHTPNALASLQAGANGLSPIGANLYPELYTFLIQASQSDTDLSVFNATLILMDNIIHQNYPWSAKFFLQMRGLPIHQNTRKFKHPVTQESYLKLEAVMTVFEQLCADFDIPKVELA